MKAELNKTNYYKSEDIENEQSLTVHAVYENASFGGYDLEWRGGGVG